MGENDQIPVDPDFAGECFKEGCVKSSRQWLYAVLILLVGLFVPKHANAQAVRFDTTVDTTSSTCVSGKQCPLLVIPGATVSVCGGSVTTLSSCLASPATTYTDYTAGTPCPTTAQLTPATGGACLATSDAQGGAGFWALPGQYNYFLRVPATAGGGTYGPYPINVGASAGCPLGTTCDANFSTLTAACTAAGTGTLFLTRTWSGLTTQSMACNIQAMANGIIKPASGQTVTLTGAFGGVLTRHFDLSAGGLVAITSWQVERIYPQWLGAVLNGSTDDTTAISQALTLSVGKSLYLSGKAAISSATITTSGAVSILCAGPQVAGFLRVSTALQASTPLIGITNASDVTVHDCYWNELGNGTNYTNAASGVFLTTVGSVDIENNFSTLQQSNAFLISGASDVKFSNNTCSYFWNACLAASGTGTVASPVYLQRLTATGNTTSHGPYGILVSVFVEHVAITGNSLSNSTIGVVQDVPYTTVTGNTVKGAVDYGNGSSSLYDCIFMEGIADSVVADNYMSGCGSRGIYYNGSQLTVSTTEQLPTLRASIAGNYIDSVSSQSAIYVKGTSFDGTVTGQQVSVKGNTISNSLLGITVTGTKYVDVSGNHEYNISNGGDTFAGLTDFRWASNKLHNTNTGSTGTQPAVVINTSYNGTVQGNTITSDGGKSNSVCWSDQTLAGGTVNTSGTAVTWVSGPQFATNQAGLQMQIAGVTYTISTVNSGTSITLTGSAGVQSGAAYVIATQISILPDNVFSNCATVLNPATTAAPTFGSWVAGSILTTFTTTTGNVLGFENTATGTPGTWRALGYLGNAGVPTISSCGGATTPTSGSNNNDGQVHVGASGSPTSCTITWSQAFSGTPNVYLVFNLGSSQATNPPTITTIDTTHAVITWGSSAANVFFSYHFQ